MSGSVNTKIDGAVLIIEISRTSKRNALTQKMYRDFSNAIQCLHTSDELSVGLICGKGECFTAGNDLSDFINSKSADDMQDVIQFLLNLGKVEKPLVAAVEGPAVGVGATMMLHCDLAYASNSAYFQMPFVNLGLCAEAGSSVLLPNLIGHHRASECLLLGEKLSAKKAERYGLINEVIDGSVYDYALEKAKMLCQQPKEALISTKKLLKQSQSEPYENIIKRENEVMFKLLHSESTQQILQSFFK